MGEGNPVVDNTDPRDAAESDGYPTWVGMGAFALIVAGLAGIIAMPGFWQNEVIDASGRRERILNLILAPIGFTNTVIILLSISGVSAVIAVTSLVKALGDKAT